MATKDWVKDVEQRYMKKSLPDFRPGDTVKVKTRIKEGNKERTQAYEGVIIKTRGSGINKTVTVRRVFQGVGVERVFLVHSPKVESIQILRKGSVRRAKLYYLRERTGKAARIREKVGALNAEAKAKSSKVAVAEPVAEPPTPEVQATPPEAVQEAAPPTATDETPATIEAQEPSNES